MLENIHTPRALLVSTHRIPCYGRMERCVRWNASSSCGTIVLGRHDLGNSHLTCSIRSCDYEKEKQRGRVHDRFTSFDQYSSSSSFVYAVCLVCDFRIKLEWLDDFMVCVLFAASTFVFFSTIIVDLIHRREIFASFSPWLAGFTFPTVSTTRGMILFVNYWSHRVSHEGKTMLNVLSVSYSCVLMPGILSIIVYFIYVAVFQAEKFLPVMTKSSNLRSNDEKDLEVESGRTRSSNVEFVEMSESDSSSTSCMPC